MKWIMCVMAVGGPYDGEISCKVKDVPDDYREQAEASYEYFTESVEGLIVWEEYDPEKDYGGVVRFEDEAHDAAFADEIRRQLELQADENGNHPGTTTGTVKEVKKE